MLSHTRPFDSQAQAMKEQAQLREEMAYQYKLGNFEVGFNTQAVMVLLLWMNAILAPN